MSNASVMTLSPLLAAMGTNAEDSANLTKMDKAQRQSYGEKVLARLGEPFRHYQIAFSLSRLFPDVPKNILSYSVWSEGDRRYEDFTLDLTVEELCEMILAATAEYGKSKPAAGKPATTRPKAKGFGSEPISTVSVPEKTIAPPAIITPEALPPVAPTTLTPDDAQKLVELSSETMDAIAKEESWNQLMGALGVSKTLFNHIKSAQVKS